MPTYDYVCGACDHAWEEFQSITAKPSRKCPECGKLRAKRKIGPGAGIIFKGSGFYQTDYRSTSYQKAAEAESKAASGGDSKGDSKSETKSETKSEAKTPASSSKPARKSGD
jgi:putative FmdB family regulatory protein